MIPYKEYVAHKAGEVKALTTNKPTVEDKENWNEEPLLPPHKTLPGAKPVLQSQEDEWKLMILTLDHPLGILDMGQWQ